MAGYRQNEDNKSKVEYEDGGDPAYLHEDEHSESEENTSIAVLKKPGKRTEIGYEGRGRGRSKPRRGSARRGKQTYPVEDEHEDVAANGDIGMQDAYVDEDSAMPAADEDTLPAKTISKSKLPSSKAGKKKSLDLDDEDEEDFDPAPKRANGKKAKSPTKKPPAKSREHLGRRKISLRARKSRRYLTVFQPCAHQHRRNRLVSQSSTFIIKHNDRNLLLPLGRKRFLLELIIASQDLRLSLPAYWTHWAERKGACQTLWR
jgi:hypothetical protein